MSIFSPHTLTWWQVGIFKIALLAIGVSAGVYWQEVFAPYVGAILIVGVLCGIYIAWVWFKR